MKSIMSDTNPFDLTKASDFSDVQIHDYWVDYMEESKGLLSIIKPRLIMPMLLLGGKGSGKTHLMRYCSYPVQKIRHGSLAKAITIDNYLGIYVRADGLNTYRFHGKGQDEETWGVVFSYYFELWLCYHLMSGLKAYVSEGQGDINESELIAKIYGLFDLDVSSEFSSLDEMMDYLVKKQRSIDAIVNNCALTRRLDGININVTPGRLIFGIPQLVAGDAGMCSALNKSIIIYLVDEVENLTLNQQKFINTLIRYRRGPSSIKVGARLYGIKTMNTSVTEEPIRVNSEFEQVELDYLLRANDENYKKMAQRLVINRLLAHGFPAKTEESSVYSYFREPDARNYYQDLCLEYVKSYDQKGKLRPYHERLRDNLLKIMGDNYEDVANLVVSELSLPGYPLLEKINILLLYKEWPNNISGFIKVSKDIHDEASLYIKNGASASPRYDDVLSHFKFDMLAQLSYECRKPVLYAGFEVILHLSQGIPRNLLGILKDVYRRATFADERPFVDGKISIQSQIEGVMDGATWFWEDAQPDSYGNEVRNAVERLGRLFRAVRYSDRPSECSPCAFSVDTSKISEEAKSLLRIAENWSYIVRVREGGKAKNDKRIDEKFQISPMLAPRWGISEYRRGTLEIPPDLFNLIFSPKDSVDANGAIKLRVSRMLAPYFGEKAYSQRGLF